VTCTSLILLEVEKENGVTSHRCPSFHAGAMKMKGFGLKRPSIAPPGACMPACLYLPVLGQLDE